MNRLKNPVMEVCKMLGARAVALIATAPFWADPASTVIRRGVWDGAVAPSPFTVQENASEERDESGKKNGSAMMSKRPERPYALPACRNSVQPKGWDGKRTRRGVASVDMSTLPSFWMRPSMSSTDISIWCVLPASSDA